MSWRGGGINTLSYRSLHASKANGHERKFPGPMDSFNDGGVLDPKFSSTPDPIVRQTHGGKHELDLVEMFMQLKKMGKTK